MGILFFLLKCWIPVGAQVPCMASLGVFSSFPISFPAFSGIFSLFKGIKLHLCAVGWCLRRSLFVYYHIFRMRVKKLPHILALHLKRFKYMEQLNRYTKLSYRVVFPLELRLFNTVSTGGSIFRLLHCMSVIIPVKQSQWIIWWSLCYVTLHIKQSPLHY